MAHALQLLDQVADARYLLPVLPIHAPAKEALQGALQIAVAGWSL